MLEFKAVYSIEGIFIYKKNLSFRFPEYFVTENVKSKKVSEKMIIRTLMLMN